MRLTLCCTMATRLPSSIVSAASTAKIGTHSALNAGAPNPCANTRSRAAKAAALGPAVMNAVTAVGAPSYTSGAHM